MDSGFERTGTRHSAGRFRGPGGPAARTRGPARGVSVPVPLGRVRWLAALGGLVAGLVAFGTGEATSQLIPPETVHLNVMGSRSTILSRSTPRVVTRSGALASGILGACLGGCLGMAGGLARRSASAAMIWGSVGSVLGLTLGAGLSFALFPSFCWARDNYQLHELIASIALHGLIWVPLGAAAGLALALGLGKRQLCGRALAAGLTGALLGAVAYDLIGALLFPLARTADPLAETSLNRLISRLLVSLATAFLVSLSLSEPRSGRPAPDPRLRRRHLR